MCGLYFVEILYTPIFLYSLFNSQIILFVLIPIDLHVVTERCNQLPMPVFCMLLGCLLVNLS